jgi:hypothetical protein
MESQILKYFLENAPYAIPLVPFIIFYLWLRKIQEDLAERNISLSQARMLLSKATLTFNPDEVVRKNIAGRQFVYELKLITIFSYDFHVELVMIHLNQNKFLNRIDRLSGGPVLSLLFIVALLCSILLYLFQLPKELVSMISILFVLFALAAHLCYSRWLIDVKRAFALLQIQKTP